MAAHKLHIAGKGVRLHGSVTAPDFRTQRVLCSDPWDFVSLWLKREHQKDALFYWEQSRQFYNASISLPARIKPARLGLFSAGRDTTTSPLPLYPVFPYHAI